MSLIDRVNTEQTVDVFQTVKLMRARRPGAVDILVSLSVLRDTFCAPKHLQYSMKLLKIAPKLLVSFMFSSTGPKISVEGVRMVLVVLHPRQRASNERKRLK